MVDYTLRRRTEAEITRIDEDWGSLNWLASRAIGNADGVTLGRVSIKTGYSNPRHTHFNCEEVLYMLRGKLEHTMGDDVLILEAGDTLVVRAGLVHGARNVGDEDVDMMVAYSSGVRDFVVE